MTRCIARHPDWPARLAAFLEARRARAFVWGEHDCALFAADWVRECAGVDLAADLRGTYSDARGALRVLNARGGLAGIGADLLPAVAPAFAGRGDVALASNAGRELLCIVDGAWLVGPAAEGLAWLPRAQAQRAWKV